MSVAKLRGKRGNQKENPRRHRPVENMETMARMNPTLTGGLSRQAPLPGRPTGKTVKTRGDIDWERWGNGWSCANPWGKRGAGRRKVRGRQKRINTLVWLSPVPDHHSLSCQLANSFLNDLSA